MLFLEEVKVANNDPCFERGDKAHVLRAFDTLLNELLTWYPGEQPSEDAEVRLVLSIEESFNGHGFESEAEFLESKNRAINEYRNREVVRDGIYSAHVQEVRDLKVLFERAPTLFDVNEVSVLRTADLLRNLIGRSSILAFACSKNRAEALIHGNRLKLYAMALSVLECIIGGNNTEPEMKYTHCYPFEF